MSRAKVRSVLNDAGWFMNAGAYVMTDGQYGSTGKGVIAGLLAELFWNRVHTVISNAGPNSGHTSFFDGEKIVLKQLPTFAVVAKKIIDTRSEYRLMRQPMVELSAGAVIDPNILQAEEKLHGVRAWVHPHAAVIHPADKDTDVANVSSIASTGQGVGPAIIEKMKRQPGAVWKGLDGVELSGEPVYNNEEFDDCCFLEVSQGFSLGINSGFYPHTTTRECTVSQALSDAGLPPTVFRKSVLSVRVHPIRVGNTENSSGPFYEDQEELSWEQLGQEAEYTTVTKRVRRVFTWSDRQFREAVFANAPSVIFLNFVNYLQPGDIDDFVRSRVLQNYLKVMKREPDAILLGFGPKADDVHLWG